ncbi:hypothetical protein D6817_02985 [Candidatus Pacearchaeota archaeon]|nr:MAG: hypothetical protein D6817_02985 [Candidatus Pacearchaeota archaeon]
MQSNAFERAHERASRKQRAELKAEKMRGANTCRALANFVELLMKALQCAAARRSYTSCALFPSQIKVARLSRKHNPCYPTQHPKPAARARARIVARGLAHPKQ